MPVNPFFNFTTGTGEQGLVEDLIVESIQIYGHSVQYVPRETVNLDNLFGEDASARYGSAYEIEVYLKSNMQFQGASETLSKFGMIIQDQASFLMAVRRFNAAVAPGAGIIRPRENDLIVIEMQSAVTGNVPKRYVFEVRFVEDKEQLFQLGKLYWYELQCELMNYGNERVETGNTELDSVATSQAYSQTLVFGSGSGTYQLGEIVYEGTSFVSAVATGTVSDWDAGARTLTIVNITGEFTGNAAVTGVSSGAVYTTTAAPATTSTDPLADNAELQATAPTLIAPITNPRFS